MRITKTSILELAKQGFKAKEIAQQLGISPIKLGHACKHFDINLRAKPRNKYEFIDDTVDDIQEELVTLDTPFETFEEIKQDQILEDVKQYESSKELIEDDIIEVEAEEDNSNEW